jgi:type I restriction enzyme, S subunit
MSDLPVGWASAAISDIATVNPPAGEPLPSDAEVSFVPMAAVEAESGSIDTSIVRPFGELRRKSFRTFEEGDVLFAKITPCMENGKAAVARNLKLQRGFGSTEFHVLRPHSGINSDFLLHFLLQKQFRDTAARNMKGTAGQLRVPTSFLAEQPIPIPPTAEQERIVAAIEEQFSRLDAGVAAVRRARQNIKRMRQSLLMNACSGHLTTEWRKNNESDLSGTSLIAQLISERRAPARGKVKQAIPPEPALIPNLPPTWTHASVDQVCSFVTDGEHITPPRTSSGVMLLSARNVQNGFLSYDVVDYITEDTYAKLARRLEVCEGDILLSCSGSVGRSALVPTGARFALVRSVAVLRPLREMGAFISLMLRSPQLQSQINTRKTETAQANIFQGQIRALTLPLPPQDEQAVIVGELAQQLALLDDLEIVLNREELRFATLRSSILGAAFSGQLVPQDSSDEPASALLAEVADESAPSKGHKPSGGPQIPRDFEKVKP